MTLDINRIPFQLSSERSDIEPPQGKRNIVHIAVNLEVWPFDQPMPREIIPSPHGMSPVPNIANFSWVEYGLRVGLPRLIDLLTSRELPVSAFINAKLIEEYRPAAEAVLQAGWELTGHGMMQKSLLSEENEAEIIEESLARIEAFSGSRPKGWMGPGFGESFDTPDILANSGIEFLFDWTVDERPCWMNVIGGKIMAIPYAVDINDVTIFAIERQPVDEYVRRYKDSLTFFEKNPKTRVITLALHPHIVGVPYRLGAVAEIIDAIADRNDTIFMTGSEIFEWFAPRLKD